MTEEQQSSPLDVSDLENMLRAIKHAHSKNAYTMEDVALLFPVVQRVEAWLLMYQKQLQTAAKEEEESEKKENKKNKKQRK